MSQKNTFKTIFNLAGLAFSVAGVAGASNAYAGSVLPQNPNVVSGQVSFSQPNSSELDITSVGNTATNWLGGFNIGSANTVKFIQSSQNAISLNRDISGHLSDIEGKLTANGHVWIINNNGVFIGQGAQINVAGILASTADITDANFQAGKYKFDQLGRPDASIINKGNITVAEGGLVALLAPGVENDGVISAKLGTVALGAGNAFTVDFYGDNLYSFSVDQKATSKAKDQNGNDMAAAIANTGTISAQGGTVYMTASVAKGIVDQAINTTGIVDATAAHVEGGTIVLDGGDGNITVAGKLDASGKGAGQTGGTIQVITSGDVALANAAIDSNGSDNMSGLAEIDAHNVTLTGGSTITTGGPLIINNSGTFSSDTPSVLLGGNVSLNQDISGSIQNAVDAIDPASGSALLTLGNGVWNEEVTIDGYHNFTLAGQGADNTILQAFEPSTPVISVANSSNATISGLTVDGNGFDTTDISFDQVTGGLLQNNGVINSTRGISITNSDGVTVDGNMFSNNIYGIVADVTSNLAITNNSIDPGTVGIEVDNSSGVLISGNSIDGYNTGINIDDGSNITVTNNQLTNINNDGIDIANITGNIVVTDNNISAANPSDGIGISLLNVSGGGNIIGDGTPNGANIIAGFNAGIALDESTASISRNIISNSITGISLANGSDNVLIDSNQIDGSVYGIAITDGLNELVSNNTITNLGLDGVGAMNVSGLVVSGNSVDGGDNGMNFDVVDGLSITGNSISHTNDAMSISGSNGAVLIGNTLTANTNGIGVADNSNGLVFATNSVTGNGAGNGIRITNSNNASFSGDQLVSNLIGLKLENAQGTRIDGVAFTDNGTALHAIDGSAGTVVSNTMFSGGQTGVLLDGEGTSMSFEGNTSRFSGMANYFVLQNQAMFGNILDASAQTFDGTRASNFTLAQWNDAEAHTIDFLDGFPVGTVFYRDFPSGGGSGSGSGSGTDSIAPINIANILRQENDNASSKFSYAGHTIASTITEVPYYFQISQVNLSLLVPNSAGVNFAGATPQQLSNLSSSAGGDVSPLTTLSPASENNTFCANTYLDSGYEINYNTSGCRLHQSAM